MAITYILRYLWRRISGPAQASEGAVPRVESLTRMGNIGMEILKFEGDDTWSSTAVSTNLDRFYALHLTVTTSYQQMTGQAFNLLVKPIRAF